MTNHYHYFIGNRIHHVHDKVVHAIGKEKYIAWRNIKGPMFHVNCSLTAVDLMVHLKSEVDLYETNKWFYQHTEKEWGCDEDYLLVYCLQRGMDVDLNKSEYVSHVRYGRAMTMTDSIVSNHNRICETITKVTGHGPTLIMSLGNLHFQLLQQVNKTFIP